MGQAGPGPAEAGGREGEAAAGDRAGGGERAEAGAAAGEGAATAVQAPESCHRARVRGADARHQHEAAKAAESPAPPRRHCSEVRYGIVA